MTIRRRIRSVLGALVVAVAWPAIASAQTGAIAGVVKDESGGVMPGVTVEASSPALIEKVRTAVTDSDGLYRIVDLPPGRYRVTFTLTGFNTVAREGIDLSAGFTATVGAELKVGTLAETIVVSGQAPLVDVQNVRQQSVMNREVIESIPTGKTAQNFAVLVPGVIVSTAGSGLTGQDVGGSVGDKQVALIVHGSRGQEMPLLYDGMRYNNMNATPGGSHVIWTMNNGAVQEFTIEVGSLSAEADVSGVRQNAVPKAGGNIFRTNLFASFTNDKFQSTGNVSDASRITKYPRIWDLNPAFGGPLKRDKVWFFGTYRYWGQYEQPPGAFYDTVPFDNVYIADRGRPAINQSWNQSVDGRITWQVTPKNKISMAGDNLWRCTCLWLAASNVAPEASAILKTYPNFLGQVTWNSPVTNQILIDAGATFHPESWSLWPQPNVPWDTYAVIEQATNTSFNARTSYTQHRSYQANYKFNVSYVTGAHAFKVGWQQMHGWRQIDNWALGPATTLRLLNGVPSSLTQYAYPYATRAYMPWYMGLFAQDQWTMSKLTLNLGLRFDFLNAYVPAQTYEATPFTPARSFGRVDDVPNWKDISPRFGFAYDLFGNGRTAIKAHVGRYLQGVTTAFADNSNPIVTSVNTINRTWRDDNGNFRPDCNLSDVSANGECGTMSNVNFGKQVITTTYDPDFLLGWGKRPYDWEYQAGFSHEVISGLSMSATWTRHAWSNHLVTDNLLASPSDYSEFCITAPSDPRLPGGGGNQICGFTDVNPNKFGLVDNLVTFAKNYGNQTDVYTGIDFTVNARLPNGILLQGGTSTGHEVWDNCDVVGKVDNPAAGPLDLNRQGVSTPQVTNLNGITGPSKLYCRNAPPLQTQVKLLGNYPLPWNMSVSATYQSIPGTQITASYVAPSSQIAPSLGRNLSAGANATATVQLVAPGTMYGDRVNQLDARFTKTFKMRDNRRIQGFVDFYNLLNVGPVLVLNTAYGAAWQFPTAVLPGRLVKFGMQLEY